MKNKLITILALFVYSSAFSQYCTSNLYSSGCWNLYIESFSTSGGVSNIDNQHTGCGYATGYYTYYPTQTHIGSQGSTVDFKLVKPPFGQMYYSIWVDWNEDFDFSDSGEEVHVGFITLTDSVSASFTIPAGTTPGSKRLRVRTGMNALTGPCNSAFIGEAEDYNLIVVSAANCASSPVAGTAVSSQATACPNLSFVLSLSGLSLGVGSTLQWQSRPAGGAPWSDIPGATNGVVSIYSQTQASDYRAYVVCGNASDTSTIVSIGQGSFLSCYCSPANGTQLTNGGSNLITLLTMPASTLFYSTPTVSASGYTLVPPTTATTTATLNPGEVYTINAGVNGIGVDEMAMWIDYDMNGIFDANERTDFTVTGNNAVATFVVPASATPGITGMRITALQDDVEDPCTTSTFQGEVLDFGVTISSLAGCTGVPIAGTATGPDTICVNTAFMLGSSGTTLASGLSFQWQQKEDGANTWTDIPGGTTKYFTIASQSVTTDYRLIVHCGTSSDTSGVLTVTQRSIMQCYCTSSSNNLPLVSSPANYITNVTIQGTTLNASSSSTSSNGYTLVPATPASNTATLNPGETYIFNATLSSLAQVDLWIDFNQNAEFEIGEKIPVQAVNSTATAYINVPASATPSTTGMRVRGTPSGVSFPCNVAGSGEIEDYAINIVTLPPCSGTPSAGSATAGVNSVCVNTPFTLTLSGSSQLAGLSYQWQSKESTSATWIDISGATGKFHIVQNQSTTTEYRAIVSCGVSGDTSIPVTVTQNPVIDCYCSPNTGHTFVTTAVNLISNVDIAGTTLNVSTSAVPLNGYTQHPVSIPTNTATLAPGITYLLDLTLTSTPGGVVAWIDYNQNGEFEVSEALTPGAANTMLFTVPTSATPGLTGMRVVAGNLLNSSGPCDFITSGEVEDFGITIAPHANCNGTPVAGTAQSQVSSACPSLPFVVYLAGASSSSGISYLWQSKATTSSNWNNVAGAISNILIATNQTTATEYRAILTCGGNSDTSASVVVNQNIFSDCYCGPSVGMQLITTPENLISGVTIPGTSLNVSSTLTSGHSVIPPTPASNTADLITGMMYNLEIAKNGFPNEISVWIDFDQSGTFDQWERTDAVVSTSTTAIANIAIPANAITGQTGMRIIAKSQGPLYGPCFTIVGEIEDYLINIMSLPPCTGTPIAGNAISNKTSVCTGTQFQLSLSNSTLASGLSYQWQQRVSGSSTWSDIVGATTLQYSINTQQQTTDYRAYVSCSGLADTSNTITILQKPFNECYCSPETGVQLVLSPANNITNVSIQGTTLNSATTTVPSNGYSLIYPTQVSNTAMLNANQNYTLTVAGPGQLEVAFWIDYNQDGIFALIEKTQLTPSGGEYIGNFTVPHNAAGGVTGMRIAAAATLDDPCDVLLSGEVEDYLVAILPGCAAPVIQTAAIGPGTITFHWTAVNGVSVYEFALTQNPAPPPGTPNNTTALSQTEVNLNGGTDYYFHLRSDCGNGSRSPWTMQQVSTWPTKVAESRPGGSSLSIYPNPTKSKISVSIEGNQAHGAAIILMDLHGRVLKRTDVKERLTEIGLSEFADGFYLLQVRSDELNEVLRIEKR